MTQDKENSTVEARLEKALAVVDAVLAEQDIHRECGLCETVHPDDGGDWEHNEECPLVMHGFVNVEGKRNERIQNK